MSGSGNVSVGTQANRANQVGGYNVVIGDSAGYNNTVSGNVMLGSKAGLTNQTGTQNTFLGYQTGYNATSSANTFIGYRSGFSTTTGQFNTFIGTQAGLSNTTGEANFFLGVNAGVLNTTGSGNFFVGNNAGARNSTGGFNVFLGTNAGSNSDAAFNNTAIGYEAGGNLGSGQTNTFIGFRANPSSGALSNAAAIGANAVVSVSNALVLGSGANVGVGTSAPTSKLHVVSGTAGQSGLRLENLTSEQTASVTNQTKFLTVDGSGNVILASTTSGGREAATEGLWQRNGAFLESAKGEAVIIGQGVNKTPSDYNLFVSKGILTEKVKVAVKNTAEWSDYVFAPGYRLAPLTEVAQYIEQHQHLPGVPSAQEMVEQGNDLHQTDAKLLEKIEELTLYLIEQRAELKALQAQNEQMKKRLSLLEAKPKH